MAWKPGESGNPAGRTPGSGKIGELRASIAEHIPGIIAKLVEQAKAGDAASARLLIERVLPPLRAVEMPAPMSLPQGSLTEKGDAVLAAVADGKIASDQGATLIAALGTLARVVESDDLKRRIEALEKKGEAS